RFVLIPERFAAGLAGLPRVFTLPCLLCLLGFAVQKTSELRRSETIAQVLGLSCHGSKTFPNFDTHGAGI
ncbi:hypothetical protein, partial [Achromobacter marplatensis]|uniref:hypothetical protein n=1 Tax=Achromobacter marplatensis TaxID=470868 RepID=UPI0028E24B00